MFGIEFYNEEFQIKRELFLSAKGKDVLFEGVTKMGDEFQVVLSYKKAKGIVHGRHVIVQFKDSRESATKNELLALWDVAITWAYTNQLEPGKNRIRFGENFPGVGSSPHIHIHAMILAGDDKLDRYVHELQ